MPGCVGTRRLLRAVSSALGVLARLVASSSLDLCSPLWPLPTVLIFCGAVVGRRLGSRASGKRCPREWRDANPALPVQEGQGCWPLGCSCCIRWGNSDCTAARMELGHGGPAGPVSGPPVLMVSQMPSWPDHPHKCLQTHQLGSWRISPSRGMIRILPHSCRQECPCRHDPQPSLDGHCFQTLPRAQPPSVPLARSWTSAGGRALWNAFAFLAEEPDLWAKA